MQPRLDREVAMKQIENISYMANCANYLRNLYRTYGTYKNKGFLMLPCVFLQHVHALFISASRPLAIPCRKHVHAFICRRLAISFQICCIVPMRVLRRLAIGFLICCIVPMRVLRRLAIPSCQIYTCQCPCVFFGDSPSPPSCQI